MNQWFSEQILDWYRSNGRSFPWRINSDPYVIWITEIVFQQTRIDQGMGHYLQFLESFPTVQDLAAAPADLVMKKWEGLGYYNRARNLHFSAKEIAFDKDGVFPQNYTDWLAVKGVGEYTAAIISSVCYNEAQAAVDGNVARVLSRFYGHVTPIDSSIGKKQFRDIANSLIPGENPGDFNQSMMDLGATICTPRNFQCELCPLVTGCVAFKESKQQDYPVKAIKRKVKTRHLNYFMIESDGSLFVRKRSAKGIWPDLYEFPLIEGHLSQKQLISEIDEVFGLQLRKLSSPQKKTHLLSHQKLIIKIFKVIVDEQPGIPGYQKRSQSDLYKLSFPKPLQPFLPSK